MNTNFSGTYTAIVTPFKSASLEIDYQSLERLIAQQIKAGVQGIVVCGSTGEAATLNEKEYFDVMSFAVKHVTKRITVIAGVGSNNTAKAAELAKSLSTLALDGLMVVAPPYNKPPQDGIVAHIAEVKKNTALPLIVYNVPGRTGVNILPKTIARMANEGLIAAVKEASGSVDQILDVIASVPDSVSVLSGDDSLTASLMAIGARGVISVASNAAPVHIAALTTAALHGDFKTAAKMQLKVLPLIRALFAESNPIPVKAALKQLKIIDEDQPRLPLIAALPETREMLRQALINLELL